MKRKEKRDAANCLVDFTCVNCREIIEISNIVAVSESLTTKKQWFLFFFQLIVQNRIEQLIYDWTSQWFIDNSNITFEIIFRREFNFIPAFWIYAGHWRYNWSRGTMISHCIQSFELKSKRRKMSSLKIRGDCRRQLDWNRNDEFNWNISKFERSDSPGATKWTCMQDRMR